MGTCRFAIVILSMAFMLGQSGCSNSKDASTEKQEVAVQGTISVYVVNYPLKYFAERIGGPHVAVHFPAPPDEDPAYWMPDAETISKYQQADLILLNGAGYEQWVQSASLPKSKLCNTSAAFAEDYIALEDALTHSHGPEGEHAHGATAFTTWLDPTLAVKQADAVRASLAELQPENANGFQKNFDALKGDLEALDRQITDTVRRASDRPVAFSHPVYQYFQRRYGLSAKCVHWEPDEPPTETMWAELKELLAEHPAKWMIWEGEPLDRTVTDLAELGLDSVTFAPCGNVPPDGDFLGVQRRNIENLARVFNNQH
jgi:zinc transport system substrate-binding protein